MNLTGPTDAVELVRSHCTLPWHVASGKTRRWSPTGRPPFQTRLPVHTRCRYKYSPIPAGAETVSVVLADIRLGFVVVCPECKRAILEERHG